MCNRMCTVLYLVGSRKKSVQITVRGGHPSGLAFFYFFIFYFFFLFIPFFVFLIYLVFASP